MDLTLAIEKLRAGLEALCTREDVTLLLEDDDLQDLVQDVESALAAGGSPSTTNRVDTAAFLPANVAIAPDDGVLVLVFRKADKAMYPTVVQLGLLTEARVDATLGVIYAEINRARMVALQEMNRASKVA